MYYGISLACQRIFIPAVIGFILLSHPVGTTFLYYIIFLITPFVPICTPKTYPKVRLFLIITALFVFISTFSIGISVILHFYGVVQTESCGFMDYLLRHLGTINLIGLSATQIIIWLLPDLILLVSILVVLIVLARLTKQRNFDNGSSIEDISSKVYKYETYRTLKSVFIVLSLIALFFSGAMRPSLTTGVYFLSFLIISTVWSMGIDLDTGFAKLLLGLNGYSAIHLLLIFAYQNPWPQELLPSDNLIARLLGLWKLVWSSCKGADNDIRNINTNSDISLDFYLSPIIIMITYQWLAVSAKFILTTKFDEDDDYVSKPTKLPKKNFLLQHKEQTAAKLRANLDKLRKSAHKIKHQKTNDDLNEQTPMLQQSVRRLKSVTRASHGTFTEETENDNENDNLSTEKERKTRMSRIGNVLLELYKFLYQHSYLLTNITMMIWSIVYLSWLAFGFLLFANFLWTLPDQRTTMYRASPYIVAYSLFLLCVTFIYGMSLNEDELPSKMQIGFTTLEEIGFARRESAIATLMLQVLFTTVFWFTLRQKVQEEMAKRRKKTLQGMMAPIQASMGGPSEITNTSSHIRCLIQLGKFIHFMCIRFWILIVMLVLFICAVTGNKMTIFRLVYMTMFLIPIILFTMSWTICKKLLYALWWIIIALAMIILCMIYTYQFQRVPEFYENILNISPALQTDIGLKKFELTYLFGHLVKPTLLIIVVVIQIHYFHKYFIDAMDYQTKPDSPSSSRKAFSTEKTPPSEKRQSAAVSEEESLFPKNKKIKEWITHFIHYSLIFLEIHLIKVILLLAISLAVAEVSALCAVIAIFAVLAANMHIKNQLIFANLITIVAAIVLLAKMVYQIDTFHYENRNYSCPETSVFYNNSFDDYAWFGLAKMDKGMDVFVMARGFLLYILVVVINAVIILQQLRKRSRNGESLEHPTLVFKGIGREESEINIGNMMKYFINFGYYKFGVELTMIALTVAIAIRMDVYSIVYSIWLMVIIFSSRSTTKKVWPFFKWFLIINTIVEYLVRVDVMPSTCIEYPWGTKKEFVRWSNILHPDLRAITYKIIADFLVLLCACQQSKAFDVEAKYDTGLNTKFMGGSNYPIPDDLDSTTAENPISDFTLQVTCWLDVMKRFVFFGLFWITLAIVFITGTTTITIFSVGYLVGSFIFLWLGVDFYLRPMKSIVSWWSYLISYVIIVLFIKSLVQIPGCVFQPQLLNSSGCWFFKLFSVTCVADDAGWMRHLKKFYSPVLAPVFDLMFSKIRGGSDEKKAAFECLIEDEDPGLIWDCISFAFLVFQYRVFGSYYFRHVVNDVKASAMLSSRGGNLIKAVRLRLVREQEAHEQETIAKVKAKMKKIKADQRRMMDQAIHDHMIHVREMEEEEKRLAPLAHVTSISSTGGYHTPLDDEYVGEGTSELISEITPLISRSGSNVKPITSLSPSSAGLSVSSEGYMESSRSTYGSPPSCELTPYMNLSDDSFSFFSPPSSANYTSLSRTQHFPLDTTEKENRLRIIRDRRDKTRRESTLSGPNQGRTGDEQVTLRNRKYSLGTNYAQRKMSEYGSEFNRMSSFRRRRRPHSWAPNVIQHEFSIPLPRISHNRHQYTPDGKGNLTHVQAIRSGDYYMFQEVEDAIQLDNINKSIQSYTDGIDDHKRIKRLPTLHDDGNIEESSSSEESEEEPPPEPPRDERMKGLVPKLVKALMVTLALKLYSYSREFRYISRILQQEKRELKSNKLFGNGQRVGKGMKWIPIPNYQIPTGSKSGEDNGNEEKRSKGSKDDINVGASTSTTVKNGAYEGNKAVPSDECVIVDETGSATIRLGSDKQSTDSCKDSGDSKEDLDAILSEDQVDLLEKEKHQFDIDQSTTKLRKKSSLPEIRILAPSLERGLDDGDKLTDDGRASPKLDSLEKDFASREHKLFLEVIIAFWYALLANTAIVCYIFAFYTMISEASVLILPVGLMIALWGTLSIPRPSKTFWITMIAYIQIVVIIKCVCQFELLPWNINTILTEYQIAPSVIMGVQRENNFAIYELILLMLIFAHRYVQKQLGIWESTDIPEPADGAYYAQNGDGTAVQIPQYEDNYFDEGDDYGPLVSRTNYRLSNMSLLGGEGGEGFREGEGSLLTQSDTDLLNELINNAMLLRAVTDFFEWNGITYIIISQEGVVYRLRKAGPYIKPELNDTLIHVTNVREDPSRYFPAILSLSYKKYCSDISEFFKNIIRPQSRVRADVYTWMFLCDFVNFLLLLIGYNAFSTKGISDDAVTSYIMESKIPVTFLIMLLLQFLLIILDRAFYLRKNLKAKVIFHFVVVIYIHIWMFFIIPYITERRVSTNKLPKTFYIIKSIYFLFAAYQIRSGYPARMTGNCLTKSYSIFNMVAFKLYMAVPFLFELRTIMDWIWTDTSTAFFEFFKVEDIFANIFILKTNRQMEADMPIPRGQKRKSRSKYQMGGTFLFLIIFIIWFPLALFAMANTVGTSNPPYEVKISVRIGPYEPIYDVTAMKSQVSVFSSAEFEDMQTVYKSDASALNQIQLYNDEDVAAVKFSPYSSKKWEISSKGKKRFIEDLKSNEPLSVRVKLDVSRVSSAKQASDTISELNSYELNDEDRMILLSMLTTTKEEKLIIYNVFPKIVKVKGSGELLHTAALLQEENDYDGLRDLVLERTVGEDGESIDWIVRENVDDSFYSLILSSLPYNVDPHNNLVLYTLNDKLFPNTLSWLTASGIVGIYTTTVLLASRIIRSMFFGSSFTIIYTDLPYVDRILQLLQDIYLVRQAKDFVLEEDLIAKLIFLYRSPETMIKWTRMPHGNDEKDTLDHYLEDSESKQQESPGKKSAHIREDDDTPSS